MQKPPEKVIHLDFKPKYDFKDVRNVIEAMEFMRNEAIKSGDEDIEVIINSAFNLCFVAYYMVLRHRAQFGEIN